MPLLFNRRTFAGLSLAELDTYRYSVYVIDYDWFYLFCNEYARQKIGYDVTGKYIKRVWEQNRGTLFEPLFQKLQKAVEDKVEIVLYDFSPVTKNKIQIDGFPLEDCYYFSVKDLPAE